MFSGLEVMAVVPAFNEERLVGRTVAGLPRWLARVVVVDDGSADRTSEMARSAGDQRLKVLRHTRNRGVGAAIVSGYRRALEEGADVVVVVGADGQMDPEEMHRLVEPIARGEADYVKGTRLTHPELRARMPIGRRIGNRVLTELTRIAVGDPTLTDSQCGYTAISRAALERVELEGLWPRYGYPNDLLGLLLNAGLRVVERPVTPIYGVGERSGIRPLRVLPGFGYVLGRAWLRRRAPG